MQVTVLAFAHARELIGFSERVVECSPEDSPRAVFARIAPGTTFENVRIALNQEYASWDEPIGNATEIALIPPVSGG